MVGPGSLVAAKLWKGADVTMKTPRRAVLAAVTASALLFTGCSPGGSGQERDTPPDGVPAADDVVAGLAAGIQKLDLTGVALSTPPADATTELKTIFAGMDDITPTVESAGIRYAADGKTATAHLNYTFPVGQEGWKYATTVPLENADGSWQVTWSPTVVHEKLSATTRLRHQRSWPKRAAINDRDGVALVEERTVYQVGIDKSKSEESTWQAAATQLAQLLKVDAAEYTQKVLAGGPKQFVVAKTVSQDQIPSTVSSIPGAFVKESTASVAPSDTFAIGLLGRVGNPSKEQVEKSGGALMTSDMVGVSGLQQRYDEQLRGAPKVNIDVVGRSGQNVDPVSLFSQEASVGSPIQLSLDRAMQEKAESVLNSHVSSGIASLVVLDVKDGGVLAAANSTGAGEYPYATFGNYAPGSTFKVVSSLALLREGLRADSVVQCPATMQIGNHTLKNYDGYPADKTGSITLTQAVANSCNTAFGTNADKVSQEKLQQAAATLGVGTDYDAGFASNFGKVQSANAPLDLSLSMIGQGSIEMSPLGMAAVSASVASGETRIPWLVKGHEAKSTATPLSPDEASQLQTLMKAVVTEGSGNVLQGVMTGAKTGTAEFGDAAADTAHAWMIAWNDKYAVAAFVQDGQSGSGTAGPLIKAMFS